MQKENILTVGQWCGISSFPTTRYGLCQEPQAEEYKTAPLRLGQIQCYLNTAEQIGILPLIYTGLSSGLRQCELITLSWADFHIRYRYISKR